LGEGHGTELCSTFYYSKGYSYDSPCFLRYLAFFAGGGTFEDFIRSGGFCYKKHEYLKNVNQYMKNSGAKLKADCVLVQEVSPLESDLVIKRDKQCEVVSSLMMQRLNGLSLNLIHIENYSEFCNPKKLRVKAYCCK